MGPGVARAPRRLLPEPAAPLRLAALSRRDSETNLDERPPAADERVAYGDHPLQLAEVRHAAGATVLVVHGGSWKSEYDLAHVGQLCEALRAHGLATVNVEYRRVGNGGGWPVSLEDVVLAVEHFRPRVLVGHSAGGHLALLAGKRTLTPVVALAPVSDPATWENPAVAAFFGTGVPAEGSPLRALPLGVPHALVHGTRDDVVPFDQSERHAEAAGGEAELVPLEGAGHFEPIDPLAAEWPVVRETVVRFA